MFPRVARVGLLLPALALAATLLASCGSKGTPTTPGGPTRSYRMGFSAIPPRADILDVIATVDLWSQRGDAAIISEELPWDSLLAGVPPETMVVREKLPLADYFRGRGHELWVYVDPANGLNRGGESDKLVAAGRSITEPEIQQMYRRWCVLMDSVLRPRYLGLALETNLIRAASSPTLYAAIRTAVNAAAADVRARDATVRLGVSVQVDYAWGRLGGNGTYAGVEPDFADFPFVQELGLSSYPSLASWGDPDSLPLDAYSRLVQSHPGVPVHVSEGGWSTATVDTFVNTPEEQMRYIRRQAAMLDRAGGRAWFQLTFTDLDLTGVPLPPGSILPLFGKMGLVTDQYVPKPALAVWDSVHAKAYAGN
jgi:hypothetical protein